MKRGNFHYSISYIFIILILLLILFVNLSNIRLVLNNGKLKLDLGTCFLATDKDSTSIFSEKGSREYALKLKTYGFLDEAAIVFDNYIKEFGSENENKSAGILYSLAMDYIDKNNFKRAFLCLLRSEMFSPNEELLQNIYSKQMICMEKLGLSIDAKNLLNNKVSLNKEVIKEEPSDVKILAKIGNEKITEGKFKQELNRLPKDLQEKIINDKNEKLNFLKNIIFMKILYNKALRLGIDKDDDILQKTEDFKRELLINQMVEIEAGKDELPSEIDLKNYYDANIEEFNKIPELQQKNFDEIKNIVLKKYLFVKRNEKINKMVEESLKVDEVKMYEENL